MNAAQANRIQSFAFLVSVFLAFCFACFSAINYLSAGDVNNRDDSALDSFINPNEAPVASMLRLPGIGRTRAEAIVAYRESLESTSNTPAFTCGEDL